jgi:uncharacterized protein YqjF (DUF2071 family)
MAQTWDNLLFAHWSVDPELVRPHVPEGITLDVHDGKAWIGITPFALRGLRPRGIPPAPYLSDFYELNVRTYVSRDGKPGIWFFSLDASSRAAVLAARQSYRLPYFYARMARRSDGDIFEHRSSRDGARFTGRYWPLGEVAPAEPGTLEYFLTERYCLYSHDGERLYRADIHHPPWPLQRAGGEILQNTMPPPGLEVPDEEPLLHFSRRQDVLVWWPTTV